MRRLFVILVILIAVCWTVKADPARELIRAREVLAWIHEAIPYVSSPAEIKSPTRTILNGGDCADMSALMVWLLEQDGIHAEMVVMDLKEFAPHHAVVRLWGELFDPVTGNLYLGEFPLPHKIVFGLSYTNLLADWRKRKVRW